MRELLTYRAVWEVRKYDAPIEKYRFPWWKRVLARLKGRKLPPYDYEQFFKENAPYEVKVVEGNLLLNNGINQIWQLVTGSGGTAFNQTNSYLGVGDSSVAPAASQTGLQGTNKYFKQVDTGFPQVSGTSCTWQATFSGTEANFTWNECGVANGNNPPTSGVLLNRLVQNLGTKQSGQTWTLKLTITLS